MLIYALWEHYTDTGRVNTRHDGGVNCFTCLCYQAYRLVNLMQSPMISFNTFSFIHIFWKMRYSVWTSRPDPLFLRPRLAFFSSPQRHTRRPRMSVNEMEWTGLSQRATTQTQLSAPSDVARSGATGFNRLRLVLLKNAGITEARRSCRSSLDAWVSRVVSLWRACHGVVTPFGKRGFRKNTTVFFSQTFTLKGTLCNVLVIYDLKSTSSFINKSSLV